MIITLLTLEEAERLPKELKKCKIHKNFNGYKINGRCWWWLLSPGCTNNTATVINIYGSVDDEGIDVGGNDCGVRPALQDLTFDEIAGMSKTKKGYIKYLGTKWIDISDYLDYPCLLKKKCLKQACRFDSQSNNYETSEIKRFVEGWFDKKINQYVRKWIDKRIVR